jgi:hypothetical protein
MKKSSAPRRDLEVHEEPAESSRGRNEFDGWRTMDRELAVLSVMSLENDRGGEGV